MLSDDPIEFLRSTVEYLGRTADLVSYAPQLMRVF